MESLKLGLLPAISHSWHRHAESWLVIRAVKSLVNGVKGFFGGYSVSLLDNVTPKLMQQHPDAYFTRYLKNTYLKKTLSSYDINIPSACKHSSQYVANKVTKLDKEGRALEVKLAYRNNGDITAIPMYYSQNSPSENLNCKVRRSADDPVKPGKEIVCRHLAWAYATGIFGRKKSTFTTINTPEKIQTKFKGTSDYPVLDLRRDSTGMEINFLSDGYYFTHDTFSDALQALINKYWSMPDGTEKNFLFDIEEHNMALRLKKQDNCMKVIFYDPNLTLEHKTTLLSAPELASHITPKNLGIPTFYKGALLNIDDIKNSLDGCDVQCFSLSNNANDAVGYGHDLHSAFRRVRRPGR